MLMRSSSHLRRELALRANLLRAYGELEADEQGWAAYAHRGNERGASRAEYALAAASDALDWAFDSQGVVGSAIRISRLQQLTSALGQALRGLGRDELMYNPQPMLGVSVYELTDPFVGGTFASSFGLRVVPPPVVEQMLLGEGTVFERSVDRLIGIFRVATEDDPEDGDRQLGHELSGLRSSTLNGIKRLAEIIADGAPSHVRWRGDELLTIAPPVAERVSSAIAEADPVETTRTIRGELRGGDLDGVFHIEVRYADGESESFTGGVEPEIRDVLRGITLGSHVRAELRVTVFDAPFREQPRELYVLAEIEETG